MSSYYLGLDLGQSQDYTALSVIDAKDSEGGKITPPELQIRYLHRFPLATPYPKVVTQVMKVFNSLNDRALVIDATGVGRPVVDLFKEEGIYPIEVLIHGGDSTTSDRFLYRVPKRDLISTLTVAFQTGKLKIASSIPEAKTLIDELVNFKVKINVKTAHDSYEAWREGQHDDLVLSVALACWAANSIPVINIENWDFY